MTEALETGWSLAGDVTLLECPRVGVHQGNLASFHFFLFKETETRPVRPGYKLISSPEECVLINRFISMII